MKPAVDYWWGEYDQAKQLAEIVAQSIQAQIDNPDVFGPYVPFDVQMVAQPQITNSIVQWNSGEPMPTPNSNPPVVMVEYVRANLSSSYRGLVPLTESVPWLRPAEVRDISVPGPLPLFGAATAFGLSRQLRRRISMGG
jgi:hypothetical protein